MILRGCLRVLLVTLVAAGANGCQSAEPVSDPGLPLDRRFQAELDALHQELGIPGATAAYALPDGSLGVAAAGLADTEAGTPMTVDSRMLAASIGKTIVGALALALAQEGKLNLDDPVSRWLGDRPWFARLPNHSTMTVRHLLTHSAGLEDHVYQDEFHQAFRDAWRKPGNAFPPEALVQFILDKPAKFEAGKGFAYTDTGYILIGLVLEKAAQRSFYEEAARRFLVPLRLNATTPSDRPELPGLASGYTPADNPLGLPAKTTRAPGVLLWNPAIEWTGGGFVSTPRDLAAWAKALYEGAAMQGPYTKDLLASVPVTGFFLRLIVGRIHYGAGVGIYEKTPLGPMYGHGGGIPGYSSSMRYYPDHRFAVAFQVNTDVDPDSFAEAMEGRLARVVAAALSGK
jgi:D-alanyl-D-alanine carboxypeptidase